MISSNSTPKRNAAYPTSLEKVAVLKSDCARELVQSSLEDLADRYVAEVRLRQNQTPLSSAQARKVLGLDD